MVRGRYAASCKKTLEYDEWTNTAANDHEVDVLTGSDAGRAFKMAQAPEGARREVYKLNNLCAR